MEFSGCRCEAPAAPKPPKCGWCGGMALFSQHTSSKHAVPREDRFLHQVREILFEEMHFHVKYSITCGEDSCENQTWLCGAILISTDASPAGESPEKMLVSKIFTNIRVHHNVNCGIESQSRRETVTLKNQCFSTDLSPNDGGPRFFRHLELLKPETLLVNCKTCWNSMSSQVSLTKEGTENTSLSLQWTTTSVNLSPPADGSKHDLAAL